MLTPSLMVAFTLSQLLFKSITADSIECSGGNPAPSSDDCSTALSLLNSNTCYGGLKVVDDSTTCVDVTSKNDCLITFCLSTTAQVGQTYSISGDTFITEAKQVISQCRMGADGSIIGRYFGDDLKAVNEADEEAGFGTCHPNDGDTAANTAYQIIIHNTSDAS